eukprot:scaffold76597_cov29-Phaeocystis_antarctica.AAC.1
MGSLYPVSRPRSWPSAAARLPAAAASCSKSTDPLLRHEVEGVHRLGSLGYQVGPSEPHLTTSGRATYTIPAPTDEVAAECHRVDDLLTPQWGRRMPPEV